MTSIAAAVRVFTRAAAIQVEDAARVAGPVAVSRALRSRRELQVEEREAAVQLQADTAAYDELSTARPAPAPTAHAAPTEPPAPIAVLVTPTALPVAPLNPPAVKVAKVVKVVAKPLDLPQKPLAIDPDAVLVKGEPVVPQTQAIISDAPPLVNSDAAVTAQPVVAEAPGATVTEAHGATVADAHGATVAGAHDAAVKAEAHDVTAKAKVNDPEGKAEADKLLAKAETDNLLERAETDNLLAKAEDAASKLPPIDVDDAPVPLRASTVPSSRLGRLFHYGSLAASLGIGAATESIRRAGGGGGEGSVFMSDANVRRLVATLGRMRGAALKLGQFMSIQDNTILPPELERVLQQVQAHANYMPDWQMEKVMVTELGKDWKSLFGAFDRIPVASASIGQVHRATLPDGTPVAVKVQFPGVAGSINSDLANLSIVLRGSAVLPKGLYLQNTIAVMRRELEDECDYIREGAAGKKFHALLKDDPVFVVPNVIDDATTGRVLTTEWMGGRPLSKMKGMDQATRDRIGTSMMRLCLRELFEFRFMQTDPNWANFLYDSSSGKIQLIDFGASRSYTKEFMDGWYRLLTAALRGDRAAMKAESESLGYLTGEEEDIMVDAHITSMVALAKPFRYDGKFPFENQTITDEVRELIPVMLKHRLTPPPAPTYSLNRKLSGAFLMCAKLGANVDCKALWEEVVGGYVPGPIAGEEEAQKILMEEAKA